jgi:hypothetical protein
MYYQVLTNVQVQQMPNEQFPNRKKLLVFSFLNAYEGSSSWQDLTQTFKLVLPKKVKVKAYTSTPSPFSVVPTIKSSYVQLGNTTGANSNLGGFDSEPAFLRGDLIKVNVGYRALVNGVETTYWTGEKGVPDLFAGFISSVQPRLPFTLECEDNMWLCKQIPTPAKNWGNKSLQRIVEDIIDAAKDLPLIKKYEGYIALKVSDFSRTELSFNVSSFTTTDDTLANLLVRIKGQYKIDSYFRGNELRIGYLHYVPEDNVTHTFTFQKNILDGDRLDWQRKDDIVLSMIVRSNYSVVEGGVTLEGLEKKKQKSTEILIYQGVGGVFKYIKKEKGKPYPAKYFNRAGQRKLLEINSPIEDPAKLFSMASPLLQRYYYDGFTGSFTTFGIPYVKHGDTVELINKELPEMSGRYKVKAVRYMGGADVGLRQEITIDYKV